MSINTNLGALMASAAASSVNKSMETSMNRLSTGLRVNTAADDAAGVAIASRLTSEIRGTNQAIRNSADAQALIDTAEGAHEEVVNILQRMRELVVQGANDTNSADDRANLQLELTALTNEIDRIGAVTSWAGQKLFAAADKEFTFQIGTGTTAASDQIKVKIQKISSADIGATVAQAASGKSIAAADVKVDTAANAITSLTKLDDAIKAVNIQRAYLGSVSNRLDSTVSNLTNISTNLEAGRSRIQDADFAAESSNLARAQILQQASTAMLAQANASKQGVLQLLQG
jgi:flagellin